MPAVLVPRHLEKNGQQQGSLYEETMVALAFVVAGSFRGVQSPCSSRNAPVKRSDTRDKQKHVQALSCDGSHVTMMLRDATGKVRGVEMT